MWHDVEPATDFDCVCNYHSWPRYDWQDTKVFVICMASRQDRYDEMCKELHRLELCSRTTFFRPTKYPKEVYESRGFRNATEYGAWDSHQKIAQKTLDWDCPVLILEDDARFHTDRFTPGTLTKVMDIVHDRHRTVQSVWDIYFLGHLPVFGATYVDENLYRTKSVLAHSYFLSKQGREKCVRKAIEPLLTFPYLLSGQSVDTWYARDLVAYGPMPSYVTQGPIASDHHTNTSLSTGWVPFVLQKHHENPGQTETVFRYSMQILGILIGLVILIIGYLLYMVGNQVLFKNQPDHDLSF